MSHSQNYLFPLILDILSNKPLLTETQSNLLKDLNQKFKDDGIKVANLKKELQTTVDLGKGLGILTVQNEEIRIPFLLKDSKAVGYLKPSSDSPEREDASKSKQTTSETNQKEKPVVPDWLTEPQKTVRKPKRSKTRGRSRKRSRSRSRSNRRRRRSSRSRRRRK